MSELLKSKYEIGLEKLVTTEGSVGVMKEELIALRPELIKTVGEVEEITVSKFGLLGNMNVAVERVGEGTASAR